MVVPGPAWLFVRFLRNMNEPFVFTPLKIDSVVGISSRLYKLTFLGDTSTDMVK